MNIYLSINNREQVIKLPVLPSELSISDPQNNENFDSIEKGEMKLIGKSGLKSFDIQSFFPANDYYFVRDRAYSGIEYIELLEEWKERRVPIRVVIDEMNINLPMAIEELTYSSEDGTKDIYYTLSLEQFRFVFAERV
ncbi:phage baseplate protein [Salsuginibacillus kocurii]|uniref:phage baseplate protein n=1 Tax=Salsuginibacillus kocurii TaxID=427078 RepID=UPI00037B07E7|nr:hypothetical protein [Salsuginibacillus kocurii]